MILFKFVSKENLSPPVKKTKRSGYFLCIRVIYPMISNSMPLMTPDRIAVSVLYPKSGVSPFFSISGSFSQHALRALKRV